MVARRLLMLVLLTLVTLGTAGPTTAAVPDAARKGPDLVVSKTYSSYRMVDVDQFNFCAGIWVTGQLKADMYFTAIEGGAYATITNPRVVNPYMLVTIKKSCDDNAAVKTYHQANVVNFRNYFYGYKCDYNPSFSASLPWGVGVGITPDCGQKTVAKYGDTQTNARRAYRFELATDGYAFRWDQSKTNTQPTTLTLCTSVSSFLIFKDTDGAMRKKVMRKVALPDACVTYKY